MVERDGPARSAAPQWQLLSRSCMLFYDEPAAETALNLVSVYMTGRQFPAAPSYGVRRMIWHRQNKGYAVSRKGIRRPMWLIRLMGMYQKANISRPRKEPRHDSICVEGCGWNGVVSSDAPTPPLCRWARLPLFDGHPTRDLPCSRHDCGDQIEAHGV